MTVYDLPGKTILMHNRMGVRIELNFDREGLLELWISPRAGESLDYRDRNFSCRDDHTRLFDRITLPGLSADRFEGCDYDPFHSTVRFEGQALHVLSLYDRPGVVLWCDAPQAVDFKSDKADTAVAREADLFEVRHPDRGRTFSFAAALGEGAGSFRHQLVLDEGRSTYARAELAPGQLLAVAGELESGPVRQMAREAVSGTADELITENDEKIETALAPGTFRLKGRPKMQRLLDLNRRVLLAMQDASGAVRAAINRIYYLIWVRDGAIIECFNAHSGAPEPLGLWTDFLLANPTVVEDEEPEGRTFLQLVNRRITKWEEDGVFYAIWSAFTAWTQTGDDRFVTGENLAVLEDAMDWLERYAFDDDVGLFGRWHRGESPLPGSRGDGHDNAVGKPTARQDCFYEGESVRRSYDVYINLFSYASYAMLATMETGGSADEYLQKADALAERMAPFFGDGLPDYGDLLTAEGEILRAGPYGLDVTDYVWGLSLTPFVPEPWRMPGIRRAMYDRAMEEPEGYFLAGLFSLLASLDPDWFDEADVMRTAEMAAQESYRPGEYLAMPNTVVEKIGIEDGHPYHDVRPQAFSVGPWLATMTGLGLRRLPFGLAVRANDTLEEIAEYRYRGSSLHVTFMGKGESATLRVNGLDVPGSLQVPEDLLRDGANEVEVRAGPPAEEPLLVESTVRLNAVKRDASGTSYDVEAHGRNVLAFRGAEARTVTVRDAAGGAVETERHEAEGRTWIQFPGRGRCSVKVT
ncbi:MAG: hypothetical protein R6X33_11765 [Candidatus Brocadiia bacterium]